MTDLGRSATRDTSPRMRSTISSQWGISQYAARGGHIGRPPGGHSARSWGCALQRPHDMKGRNVRPQFSPEFRPDVPKRWVTHSRPLIMILLGSLFASACGNPSRDPATAPSPQDSEPPSDLTIAMAFDSDEPLLKQRTGINMCEPLVHVDENFRVQPLLATSWEYRGENTFRFELRNDVTFHDGTPFDAEAVRHSLQLVVEEGLYNATGLGPDSVNIIDDYTVDITAEDPNLRLVETLGHPGTSIVKPGSDPAEQPVCTGPFRFVDYVPDRRLTVERFDEYWGTQARVGAITVNLVPDETTRTLALQAGDVDMIKDVSTEDLQQLEGSGFQTVKANVGATFAMPLNIERSDGILVDVDVRRALALSLDREALVAGPLGGEAEFVQVLGSPEVLGPAAEDVQGFHYEPERAEAILQEEGWQRADDGIREKEGRRLTLRLIANPGVSSEAMQLLQAQARRTGFDISVQFSPDAGTFYDQLEQGAWDLLAYVTNQGDASPVQKSEAYVTGESFGKWSQPGGRFDEIVAEANATADLAESQSLAAQSQRVLIEDAVAILPLAGIARIWAMRPSVEGFVPHPNWLYQHWEEVHLSND